MKNVEMVLRRKLLSLPVGPHAVLVAITVPQHRLDTLRPILCEIDVGFGSVLGIEKLGEDLTSVEEDELVAFELATTGLHDDVGECCLVEVTRKCQRRHSEQVVTCLHPCVRYRSCHRCEVGSVLSTAKCNDQLTTTTTLQRKFVDIEKLEELDLEMRSADRVKEWRKRPRDFWFRQIQYSEASSI